MGRADDVRPAAHAVGPARGGGGSHLRRRAAVHAAVALVEGPPQPDAALLLHLLDQQDGGLSRRQECNGFGLLQQPGEVRNNGIVDAVRDRRGRPFVDLLAHRGIVRLHASRGASHGAVRRSTESLPSTLTWSRASSVSSCSMSKCFSTRAMGRAMNNLRTPRRWLSGQAVCCGHGRAWDAPAADNIAIVPCPARGVGEDPHGVFCCDARPALLDQEAREAVGAEAGGRQGRARLGLLQELLAGRPQHRDDQLRHAHDEGRVLWGLSLPAKVVVRVDRLPGDMHGLAHRGVEMARTGRGKRYRARGPFMRSHKASARFRCFTFRGFT